LNIGKKVNYLISFALLSQVALADTGYMMGKGTMHAGYLGLYKVIYFVLASFVFSVIFWGTREWLLNSKKGKGGKK